MMVGSGIFDVQSLQTSPNEGSRSNDSINETHVTLQITNVSLTKNHLLVQEDTDCDGLITVDDKGPKLFVLEIDAKSGSGFFKVSGNYAISVLLQELSLATTSSLLLSSKVFTFSPVERLSMMIRNIFWPSLTRTIDCHGTMEIFKDPKVNDNKNGTLRVYVGYYDTKGLQYFKHARKKNPKLQAIRLPKRITPGYMREIRHKPGILALKIDYGIGGCLDDARGVPYVVPGGRFNEMYGWDSYFIALGLLADGNVNLARSIADNLLFQVQNYGKVLNANRSYYLGRSHPPFLTDLLRQIYDKTPAKNEALVDWLCDAFALAIKEYWGVWCSDPRFVEACGLSRYMPESTGMSRETESSHYDSVFKPIADAYGMTVEQLKRTYSEKHKKCPKSRLFDKYFCHDQSMRESGHDTTYRLDNVSADLLPVDLNCLLYKYERDIAWFLREFCDEETLIWRDEDSDYTLRVETHDLFESRAKKRRQKIFDLMWSRRDGLLYDYNYKARRSSRYKSATVFYALWSGICGERHARKIVRNLPTFEMEGGVVSGSKDSLQTKNLSLLRPNRQWDHPYGWAPHQMIVWLGLRRYGFLDDCERLVYRWLLLITKIFTEYNGTVAEKYDVVSRTHKVEVEYGNVGCAFKEAPKEGFGWVNASYVLGLTLLSAPLKEALSQLKETKDCFKNCK